MLKQENESRVKRGHRLVLLAVVAGMELEQ